MGALSDLKVLEFSDFISGPYCSKYLADLGAEVIKVESPGLGDKARNWGPFPQDLPHLEKSGLFLFLNTNKRGVTLNVNTATGAKIFRELARWADILVESHPPLDMDRLGFDYQSLSGTNQRLVVTSVTHFGQTGPYRDYKACDFITMHCSGQARANPALGVNNTEQESPLTHPAHAGDFRTGLVAAISTMSAIVARERSGKGQHVDVSKHDAVGFALFPDVVKYTSNGVISRREKGGKRVSFYYGPCRDGQVVIMPQTDAFWQGLKEMMGGPDWAESDLCLDVYSRRINWDAIEVLVEEWAKEHSLEEVTRLAAARRVPCSPLNSVGDLVNDEQLAARDYFVEVEHGEAGRLRYPGAPLKFSETPWQIRRPAPLLGEHNAEVYCGLLGYSRQDLVRLRQASVI